MGWHFYEWALQGIALVAGEQYHGFPVIAFVAVGLAITVTLAVVALLDANRFGG